MNAVPVLLEHPVHEIDGSSYPDNAVHANRSPPEEDRDANVLRPPEQIARKRVHLGRASSMGLESAILAKKGLQGPVTENNGSGNVSESTALPPAPPPAPAHTRGSSPSTVVRLPTSSASVAVSDLVS